MSHLLHQFSCAIFMLFFTLSTPVAASDEEPREEIYKVVVVGNCNVGKTSIVERIAYPKREFGSTRATLGVEFYTIRRQLGDESVRLVVYDTAGATRLRDTILSFFRGANGVVLVFDITNRESFNELAERFDSIQKAVAGISPELAFVVVGNKTDLARVREVSQEEGRQFADSIAAPYIEASAKGYDNIWKIFDTIARNCRIRATTLPEFRREDLSISTSAPQAARVTRESQSRARQRSSSFKLERPSAPTDKKEDKNSRCCS
jgi:Ras-related protein Rab-1A